MKDLLLKRAGQIQEETTFGHGRNRTAGDGAEIFPVR